jgi:hypothetical protein
MPAFGRTLAAECQERHDRRMGSGRTRSTTPGLFSTASARVPSPSVKSPSSTPSYALPKNLPDAISYLDDDQLDRLLAAVLAEQRRRGKKIPVSDNSPPQVSGQSGRTSFASREAECYSCCFQSWFYAVSDCATVPNFRVGCEKSASKRSIEIATQTGRVYVSVGCGP